MLTTWLNKSIGHPLISEFPNVERIANKVKTRKTVTKVYGC